MHPKPFIIPLFLPQWGCPQHCVYCRQETITGERRSNLDIDDLSRVVEEGLASKRRKKGRPVEIAFYGGNFTGLAQSIQQALLGWAGAYLERGLAQALRLSTRPDAVTAEGLDRLKRCGVRTVELGFQALDDRVLSRSLRGHGVGDNLRALDLVKEKGLSAGVQLMPGLPGDCPEGFLDSLRPLINRPPDFVRLYPALVFEGTVLARWYRQGVYRPLELEEALDLCRRAVDILEAAGIPVLRLGLQSPGKGAFSGNLLAGPFHPSFGDLVRGRLFREKIMTAIRSPGIRADAGLEIRAGDREAGYLTGNGGENLAILKSDLGCPSLTLTRVPDLQPGEWEFKQMAY